MSATYLVRFDDICSTMNWDVWKRIEEILIDSDVKPILAVVPDNCDPVLNVSPPNPDFWTEARRWQAMGWTIALHGYRHEAATSNSGLLGLNNRSEFAGLPYQQQLAKLEKAADIFREEGIDTNVWVAPGHSFDRNTVDALRSIGIDQISDGLFVHPHFDASGALWVPQQLWRFRAMPRGVWTVCCHHNSWSPQEFEHFRDGIMRFGRSISSFTEIANNTRHRRERLADSVCSRLMLIGIQMRRRGAK